MKNSITYLGRILIVFFVATILQAEAPVYVPASQILDIPIEGQQHKFWCWAASISMAAKFLNSSLASDNSLQCKLAKAYSGYTSRAKPSALASNCSSMKHGSCLYSPANPSSCVSCFKPLDALTDVDDATHLAGGCGINASPITGVDKLDQIRRAILAGNPVLAIYAIRGSSGASRGSHAVLIRGYVDHGSENALLLINNPMINATANCKGCFFVINTKPNGENELNTVLTYSGHTVHGDSATYMSTGKFIIFSKRL